MTFFLEALYTSTSLIVLIDVELGCYAIGKCGTSNLSTASFWDAEILYFSSQ
jgi:hypothetical protein